MYEIRETNDQEKVKNFINFLKEGLSSKTFYSSYNLDAKAGEYLDILSDSSNYKSFIVAWKSVIRDIENEQWKLKNNNKRHQNYSGKTNNDVKLTNLYKLRTLIRKFNRETEYV